MTQHKTQSDGLTSEQRQENAQYMAEFKDGGTSQGFLMATVDNKLSKKQLEALYNDYDKHGDPDKGSTVREQIINAYNNTPGVTQKEKENLNARALKKAAQSETGDALGFAAQHSDYLSKQDVQEASTIARKKSDALQAEIDKHEKAKDDTYFDDKTKQNSYNATASGLNDTKDTYHDKNVAPKQSTPTTTPAATPDSHHAVTMLSQKDNTLDHIKKTNSQSTPTTTPPTTADNTHPAPTIKQHAPEYVTPTYANTNSNNSGTAT